MQSSPRNALLIRMAQHAHRPALMQPDGHTITHADLLHHAHGLQPDLQGCEGKCVAFIARPGVAYLTALLGIWAAGAIAVPLPPAYPQHELAHIISTTQPALLLAEPEFAPQFQAHAEALPIKLLHPTPRPAPHHQRTAPSPATTALILFTSGTTARPKGVAITHANLEAQMDILCTAWQWTTQDTILHALPLHHVHGITNAMLCAIWAGASIRFLPRFEPAQAWQALADPAITIFMGVPTMYARLLDHLDTADEHQRRHMQHRMRTMRLWVSGSAALPATLQARWKAISGRYLLERYGMTEIGMALGIPYGQGRPGSVGLPFQTVQVRVVDEHGHDLPAGEPGELWVKGPSVFAGYWGLPEATAAAFNQGWFMTGDIVQQDEDAWFRILGRRSADIIKSGGYKLSALEIEEVFREHPAIRDCAVIGLPHPDLGESVAMVIAADQGLDPQQLLDWAKGRIAAYKLPRRMHIMPELPRNAMGKVIKANLKPLFQ